VVCFALHATFIDQVRFHACFLLIWLVGVVFVCLFVVVLRKGLQIGIVIFFLS
jgi:hypothetical protein